MTTIPGHSQDDQPHVILVEDDDELREGLAEYLRLSGVTVAEANTGAAFREAFKSASFDVVILDVNLPDTTGFVLAEKLAREPRRPGIIMLTARTSQKDRIQGYSDGADLYMTKPVDGEELRLAVRNLVRRMQDHPHDTTHPKPVAWRLDLQHNRLTAPDGCSIALSGRETMMIEQFARSDGAPVSRAALADILGYDSLGPESRALDAVLRRLRQKMAEAGTELPVVSVHNVGIRFSAPLTLA